MIYIWYFGECYVTVLFYEVLRQSTVHPFHDLYVNKLFMAHLCIFETIWCLPATKDNTVLLLYYLCLPPIVIILDILEAKYSKYTYKIKGGCMFNVHI